MKLILGLNASHLVLPKDAFRKLDNSLHHSKLIYREIPKTFWHINLLTLSEVKKETLPELKSKMETLIKHHPEFSLKLSGLWAYPNQEEGRLLWIGVQNSIALRFLQEDVVHTLKNPKDIWDDKVFKPILPVLRFKNHHNVTDLISPYKGYDFGKMKFDSILLLEMTRTGAFPEFKVLHEFQLPAKPADLALSIG